MLMPRLARRLSGAIAILISSTATAQGSLKPLALVREARFGTNDGSSAELGPPGVMLPGPDGHVFIFDGRDRLIKEYERTGRFVRTIGRKGDGPGEFNNVDMIGFLDDTLWTADPVLRRVTLFPGDRRHPVTLSLQFNPQLPATNAGVPHAMLRGGFAMVQGTSAEFFAVPLEAPVASPLVRMRRDGTMVDTTVVQTVRTASEIYIENTGALKQPFLARQGFWAGRPGGDGYVVLDAPAPSVGGTSTFVVHTYDGAGKLVLSRLYRYKPVALSARVRDSVIRALLVAVKAPSAEREVRSKIVVPPYLPAVNRLLVGRDGSVWIERERYVSARSRWEVLDVNGVPIGFAELPEGFWIRYADLTQVLGIEHDADGLAQVVRLAVRR